MTITISADTYWETTLEMGYSQSFYDPDDPLDTLWQCPPQFGTGQSRFLELREELVLCINHGQLHENVIMQVSEREHPLEFGFYLSGVGETRSGTAEQSELWNPGSYFLAGSGLAPQETSELSAKAPLQGVNFEIEPELFRSFLADPSGELPSHLRHLICSPTQTYYTRAGTITLAMQIALQQILYCPYWGFTKRMYLESRILELMTLVIEQESELRVGGLHQCSLKSQDVERIHAAKELLIKHLGNPLSLTDLARQVGLNDCTLKRGFQQVFGTTVFGYLHDYRMEQARQLLQERHLNVEEVARLVGYANRRSFAAAFRRRFGISPKYYNR